MENDENYYRALNVIDRIEKIRIEQNISTCKLSLKMKFTRSYYDVLYARGGTNRIETIIRLAKALDVNVGYLLNNKPRTKYIDFDIDYSIIAQSTVHKLSNSLCARKCYIKHNKFRNVSIKTLFDFEKVLGIPAINLIGGK